MNRDRAIKILSSAKFGRRWPRPKAEVDAIKLSIEALEIAKWLEENKPDLVMVPLLSEIKG